jgi:UDP-glucose 4-epimerase
VLCFSKHIGIDSLILRYFNTYGKRQTFTPYVGVITIFVQKLCRDEELPIFGDGTQIRDFISVDDVAEANMLGMEYSGPFQIFNIGTGSGTTINSLARILKEMMNKDSPIHYLPLQPGEPSSSVADITLAKKELGFTPRLKVEEKLRDVIEWNLKEADRE